MWMSPDVIKQWRAVVPNGQRGRDQTYSEVAIESMAILQAIYHLPLRQTQGLLESLFILMTITLAVPSYSTLSRRKQTLTITLPQRRSGEGVHVVIDSTGVKVFGEGEWKVRQHGWSKRRTWKKLHVAVDEATGEILASKVTDNSVTDGSVLPELLEQIEASIKIDQVSADKAYDKRKCYDAIHERGARATIPPQKGAHIWQHGNTHAERLDRDENLRAIRKIGKVAWKRACGYHRRSIAETTMSRFKRIFGPTISARTFEGQVVEINLRGKILNQLYDLGRPDSYRVD